MIRIAEGAWVLRIDEALGGEDEGTTGGMKKGQDMSAGRHQINS